MYREGGLAMMIFNIPLHKSGKEKSLKGNVFVNYIIQTFDPGIWGVQFAKSILDMTKSPLIVINHTESNGQLFY